MNPQTPYPAWIVLETQSNGPGVGATLSTIYYDYDSALSAYFAVCASATQSQITFHSAMLIPLTPPWDKKIERWEVFDRREDI